MPGRATLSGIPRGFATLAMLGLAVASRPIGADTGQPMTLTRVDSPIMLDGRADDAAWRRVEPLSFTQLRPHADAAPSEETVVRIAYDDDYLYAVAEMVDAEPRSVRANALQRDTSSGDDLFGLVLDSFDDNENAVAFYTNAAGTRIDETIANDAEQGDGRVFNRSWNTFWDAAAVRTDAGWSAEMRIPWTSLRFQNDEGRVTMGLIAWRYIARKDEHDTFPRIDPSLESGHVKPSAARDVVITGVEPRSPVHTTAYLLGGRRESVRVDDDETSYALDAEDIEEVGLDVKYALTPNLALDVTVNTDFAQVEADDAQVNLSRFSLFQSEKRQFFQERSSLFDFGTGGASRLFYSRRIGLSPSGEPVPILGGVRLVGRVGDWDVGLLDMLTRDLDTADGIVPEENFGVLRLRRQVLNDRSYLGGMVTSRVAPEGHNLAWGLDSVLRLTDLDELTVRVAQTFDEDPETGDTSRAEDSLRVFASVDRRTQDGFGYTVIAGYSGEDYQPDLGFVARTGFYRLNPALRWNRLGTTGQDSYRRIGSWLDVDAHWRTKDGSLESGRAVFGFNRQSWAGGWYWIEGFASRENLLDGFSIGDVTIEPGDHRFFEATAGVELPGGRDWTGWGNVLVGSFYDGERYSARVNPKWKPSPHWEVGGSYQWNHLRFPDRDQATNIHLARLRLRYAFDGRLSVDLFSQYSSLAGQVGNNLRLRYNLREGTDLWVVYNEATAVDRLLDSGLELPRQVGRTVLVKYSYTLSI